MTKEVLSDDVRTAMKDAAKIKELADNYACLAIKDAIERRTTISDETREAKRTLWLAIDRIWTNLL